MSTTRTRKPSAQRRREIARAILHIIGERGLTSLTTATVAEEIGVTSGALFRHFASRDEMLHEAVSYALTRIETTFPDPSLPPLERLLALARNRVDLLGSDPGLAWLLRSEQVYLTLPEDAVQGLRGMVERSASYLLQAIREGAAEGSIRDDIEPQLLLVPVMGTIHALVGMSGVHRVAPGKGGAEPERVLSALQRLLAPPKEKKPRPSTRKKRTKRPINRR